jgi:hypothetical protein
MSGNKQLQQMVREIKDFMKYTVAADLIQPATAVINRYCDKPRILNLLREYYVALPDAREEPALRIAELIQHQGVSLFVVTTPSVSYLYASSASQVVWLGQYKDELDPEILDYFGFDSQEEFLKICPPAADLEEYGTNRAAESAVCPACGVGEGELHLLGCSVEICPWCEGQLCKCNCRFEQLELDAIDREEQLEEFEDLLTAKGRIPFKRQQAPYYPGTSDGLDGDEPDK